MGRGVVALMEEREGRSKPQSGVLEERGREESGIERARKGGERASKRGRMEGKEGRAGSL